MIKNLTLENFRKHEHFTADFTAGLNGIFGPNYKGKSTILYGILFALGGPRHVPCKTTLRNGAASFKVDMTFSPDGNDYRVVRTKSTDRLYKGCEINDANLIASGTTVVHEKIEELIGMTMKRFVQTRYARQKLTHAILLSGANELYAAINEISGADTVDKALGLLTKRVDKLDGYLDNVEVPDVGAAKAALQFAETAVASTSKVAAALQQERDAAQAALTSAETALGQLQTAATACDNHQRDLERAERDLQKATETLRAVDDKLKALSDDDKAAHIAAGVLDLKLAHLKLTLQNELRPLATKISNAKRDITHLQDGLVETQKSISLLVKPGKVLTPKTLETLKVKVETTAASMAVKQAKLTELASSLESSECPTCHRAYDTCKEGSKEVMQAEHAALTTEVTAMAAELKSDRSELSKAEAAKTVALAAVTAYESSLAAFTSQLNRGKASLETATAEWDDLTSKMLAACPDGVQKMEDQLSAGEESLKALQRTARAVADLQKDWTAATGKLSEAGDTLAALKSEAPAPADAAALAALTAAVPTLRQDCQELLAKAATAESVATQAAGAVQEAAKRLNKAENELDQYSAHVQSHSNCKSLAKFLKSNRDRYMADVWETLMATASQFANQCTSGDIDSMARTEDGTFTYTEGGVELAISEASGAQLSIMGLAMQVALAASVQSSMDILIVDEPNADMDTEHSLATNMLLSAAVGQVICVSHAHMDSSVCQNVIEL